MGVLQQRQGPVEIEQRNLLGNLSQALGQAWLQGQCAQLLERAQRTRIAGAQQCLEVYQPRLQFTFVCWPVVGIDGRTRS